jgi:hypothetical protein
MRVIGTVEDPVAVRQILAALRAICRAVIPSRASI